MCWAKRFLTQCLEFKFSNGAFSQKSVKSKEYGMSEKNIISNLILGDVVRRGLGHGHVIGFKSKNY